MLSKSCPIQRPAFGFLLQKQADVPASLRTLGGQTAVSLEIKQVVANHHELRANSESSLYCIFCGTKAESYAWEQALHSTENNGQTP